MILATRACEVAQRIHLILTFLKEPCEILCGSGKNHCLLGLYYCPLFSVSRAKLLKNVLHKEIHSGAALNNLNESATVLFRPLIYHVTLQSANMWPIKVIHTCKLPP